MAIYALIDGNAFYCSCEQIFRPSLRGRPMCVLSNNDGNAIARTDEAKRLGIKMGQPAHELRDFVRRDGLILASANFELYGDISRRVVDVLRTLVPRVEIYSIDESFADVTRARDRVALAHQVRDRVRRWVGIPTCVGVGPTKTLAKAGNKAAKRGAGVLDLCDLATRDAVLAELPVGDVWGVGRKWEAKLQAMGVATAAQLRDLPSDFILERFGVVLARTQRELQGHECIELQEVEPDRQQIVVSRSFGQRVEDLAAVGEAIATFAARACAKARARGLVSSSVWLTATSDVFRPELRQHHASKVVTLGSPTADTRAVLNAIRSTVRSMLQQGVAYKRAGVALLDLARPSELQGDLFRDAGAGISDSELMSVVDAINRRFGSSAVGFGATGWRKSPAWRMRQASVSPRYTTRFSELPQAIC